jgi:hypothetical protein
LVTGVDKLPLVWERLLLIASDELLYRNDVLSVGINARLREGRRGRGFAVLHSER